MAKTILCISVVTLIMFGGLVSASAISLGKLPRLSLEKDSEQSEPPVSMPADRMEIAPFRCLYVGDDPDKDVAAAHAAGMPAAWVDRAGRGPGRYRAEIYLTNLAGLPEAIVERFG